MSRVIYVKGWGYYAPERVLHNSELSEMVDTTDEWIRARTGIEQRHIAAAGENCSDMIRVAASRALEASGHRAEDITHLIVSTVSGDDVFPSTATRLQRKLGIKGMAFDISAACAGFIYALHIARGLLAVEPKAKILVTSGEVLSVLTDWTDRSTCVLFGDGAGAAVLSCDPEPTRWKHPLAANAVIEDVLCNADGDFGDLLFNSGGGSSFPYKRGDVVGAEKFIQMNGRELFRHAVRNMGAISERLLEKLGIGMEDVDLVIPHQANLRIISAVAERLGVPEEKLFVNVQKYGNTSAASIPIALCEALEQGRLKPGMRMLGTVFGAGLVWGAVSLKF